MGGRQMNKLSVLSCWLSVGGTSPRCLPLVSLGPPVDYGAFPRRCCTRPHSRLIPVFPPSFSRPAYCPPTTASTDYCPQLHRRCGSQCIALHISRDDQK